jgi:hypothetical protein
MIKKSLLLIPLFALFQHFASAQADSIVIDYTFPNGNKLARKNTLSGIISPTGQILYPFEIYGIKMRANPWRFSKEYPDTVFTTEGEKIAITKQKYGLMNPQTGEVILPAVYNYIDHLSNDRILISNDSLTGMMHAKTLKYLLQPVYRNIKTLNNGNYIVTTKDTLYFLNASFHPISKFHDLKRFEPTADDCVFIYRTTTHEGIADCEGKKFTYPNWKEVRDTENGLAIVKTTEGNLAVYNIHTKAKILERPNQTHSISIARNGIKVYDGKTTTLYDFSGKEIK